MVAVGAGTAPGDGQDAELAASETPATLHTGLRCCEVDEAGPGSGKEGDTLWSTSRAHGLMLAIAALRPVPAIVFRTSEVRAAPLPFCKAVRAAWVVYVCCVHSVYCLQAACMPCQCCVLCACLCQEGRLRIHFHLAPHCNGDEAMIRYC